MCDTIVVKRAGAVFFAKNSGRDPNEAQMLDWQPRTDHPAGATVRCTWIEIPQVRRTHAVLLSRPFWMWGAEMGANEHDVVIGNEAIFTREPYAATGLTGMDLLRLALERADSAEAAVEAIVQLLETHGQGGGCGHEHRTFTYHNSFLVADPARAFVLETAGRRWATEEVSAARSISNGLTIEPFARDHSDTVKTWASSCRLRRARTQHLADEAHDAAAMMRILRDHGAGHREPHYNMLNGGLTAPCMHAGGLAAASQTTASWVAELRPEGARHWVTATAAPCCGLFKPVRVSEPLTLAAPTDTADNESLWWRNERLHRQVVRDPATLYPKFTGERDEVERRWLADPPEPAEAFAQGDRLLERWTADVLAVPVSDTRPWYVRRYWAKRDLRAGMREPYGSAQPAADG